MTAFQQNITYLSHHHNLWMASCLIFLINISCGYYVNLAENHMFLVVVLCFTESCLNWCSRYFGG